MQILNNSFPRTKRKVTTTLFHHHGHVLQVHEGDQSSLTPLWNSFVGTGIHNGPVPPAAKNRTSFTSFEKVHTHTQPTKTRAGYAWATQHDMTWTRGTLKWDQPPKSTKTGQRRKETQQGPQTTVQQQQAEPQHSQQPTHTPNKSTGKQQDTRTPASKARPTDRRGTAAKQGPTDRPARFVYVSKEKRKKKKEKKNKVNKITMEPSHYHEHVQIGWKAQGPAMFKLDSWQLSVLPRIDARLYLTKKTKKKEYHLQTWAFCKIIQLSGFDAVGRAGGRMFFNTDVNDLNHVSIFIPESRTT